MSCCKIDFVDPHDFCIEMLYRIAWTMPDGYSGHGDYCLNLKEGEILIQCLEKKYPDMKHWLEPCVQKVD